jgi:hypothetical protein
VLGHKGSGRRRLTYANVTSTIALIIAISGGTAFAASHLITGNETAQFNQVANGQCGGSGYEVANITAAQGLSGGGLNIIVP